MLLSLCLGLQKASTEGQRCPHPNTLPGAAQPGTTVQPRSKSTVERGWISVHDNKFKHSAGDAVLPFTRQKPPINFYNTNSKHSPIKKLKRTLRITWNSHPEGTNFFSEHNLQRDPAQSAIGLPSGISFPFGYCGITCLPQRYYCPRTLCEHLLCARNHSKHFSRISSLVLTILGVRRRTCIEADTSAQGRELRKRSSPHSFAEKPGCRDPGHRATSLHAIFLPYSTWHIGEQFAATLSSRM